MGFHEYERENVMRTTPEEKNMRCQERAGFVEIMPCPDTRMSMSKYSVNESVGPEGILEFDEELTLLYGYEHFYRLFGGIQSSCFGKYH